MRVKTCAIAPNCLNLFMHASKTIQAAKYMIMTVAGLIERVQDSVVRSHEIAREKSSFRKIFVVVVHVFSFFPVRSCENLSSGCEN